MRAWAGALCVLLVPASLAPQQPRGKAVYDRWCAGCHGDTGAGDGPGAARMLPRPRDFTRGVYQVRTTASGELPTDEDLQRVVDEGMPGTAMPGWKSRLSEQERADVIAYIKRFSEFFAQAAGGGGSAPKALEFGDPPGESAEGLAEGRKIYRTLECFKCHGDEGRGDGPSAPTLTDDWDHPIRAANLSKSWNFNGGASVEQIYRRMRTGLDGTPMPSYSDALDQKLVTPEQLWRVAQFVRSLSPEEPPEVREVVRAGLAGVALPRSPADTAWRAAARHWVPLVGQIVVKPRWFAPTVDGVWVQALHDGRRLAILVTWDDPSRSPDPKWDEWLGRTAETMDDGDVPPATTQGPDRFVVQFPTTTGADAELPYFLGGSTRRAAHVWRWTSAPDRVEIGTSTGLGRVTPTTGGAGPAAVAHAARFADGQWQLQLTRALVPADTTQAPAFRVGRAVPIAFYAADGSNGEDSTRGAVSAWYAIHLDVPTPPRVYAAPAVATLLTAGLGLALVTRAQRRERSAGRSTSPHTQEE